MLICKFSKISTYKKCRLLEMFAAVEKLFCPSTSTIPQLAIFTNKQKQIRQIQIHVTNHKIWYITLSWTVHCTGIIVESTINQYNENLNEQEFLRQENLDTRFVVDNLRFLLVDLFHSDAIAKKFEFTS